MAGDGFLEQLTDLVLNCCRFAEFRSQERCIFVHLVLLLRKTRQNALDLSGIPPSKRCAFAAKMLRSDTRAVRKAFARAIELGLLSEQGGVYVPVGLDVGDAAEAVGTGAGGCGATAKGDTEPRIPPPPTPPTPLLQRDPSEEEEGPPQPQSAYVFDGELLRPPGADWPVPAAFQAEMERLCPDVDVVGEYGAMADWLLKTAASRRWTRRGIRTAVRKWLRGEQRKVVMERTPAEPCSGGLGPPPR